MRNHRCAALHLRISSDGRVHCQSAERFSSEISRSRHANLSDAISESNQIAFSSAGDRKRQAAKSRSLYLSAISKQWVPISRFLTISAIADRNNEILASSTSSVIEALSAFHAPALDGSNCSFNNDVAQSLLNETVRGQRWDWSVFRLPDATTFDYIIWGSTDSGPGRDGIP